MIVPTMLVEMKDDGRLVLINVSDFDERKHAIPEASAALPHPTVPAVVSEPEPTQAHSITDLTVIEAKALVGDMVDESGLEVLRAQEVDHPEYPGGRRTVLSAIDKRAAALMEA